MQITWLGQAGLMFESRGKILLVDPYLSDSVSAIQPSKHRKMPPNDEFLQIHPDYILLTHDHADHTDEETLSHYLCRDENITVLASGNAWQRVSKFGGRCNYVLFNRGTTWTEKEFKWKAIYAEHSDACAIGSVITAEGKNFYVTGDTLYNEKIFPEVQSTKIYAVFLPINGEGNNMNAADAEKFVSRIGAKFSVPIHFGMFDNVSPACFKSKNKIVPDIYQPIRFKISEESLIKK